MLKTLSYILYGVRSVNYVKTMLFAYFLVGAATVNRYPSWTVFVVMLC